MDLSNVPCINRFIKNRLRGHAHCLVTNLKRKIINSKVYHLAAGYGTVPRRVEFTRILGPVGNGTPSKETPHPRTFGSPEMDGVTIRRVRPSVGKNVGPLSNIGKGNLKFNWARNVDL